RVCIPWGGGARVSPARGGKWLAPFSGVGASALGARPTLAWPRETPPPMRWAKLLVLLAADVACVVAVVVALNAQWELRRMHFGAGLLAVAVLGIWLIERYSRVARGIRWLGHALVAATTIGLGIAGRALLPQV